MAEPAPAAGFDLDSILLELGSFGKYQLVLLLLLAFRDSFLAMCNMNYVFTAAQVPYRCYVPECEAASPAYNASWAPYAGPGGAPCQRYVPRRQGPGGGSGASGEPCNAASFSQELAACDRYVYANNNTIFAEFDLGCQSWKSTLIGTVHNLGLVVSLIVSGLLSDRYGRKFIIVTTPLMVGMVGLVKSFSTSYWMLVTLEFIETAFGYGNASMVLSLETVSNKRRVIFACILDMMGTFGHSFFGLIAWKVPYWRNTLRVIYAPLLVVVFYIFLVDEGVRWLLAKGKKNEAIRILNKVAKFNNVTLSNTATEMMKTITGDTMAVVEGADGKKSQKQPSHLLTALKSKTICFRLVICSICNMCATLTYFGLIIHSTNVSVNKYLNYSLVILVSIPTRVLTAFVLSRYGRKWPMFVAFSLCALACIGSAMVPEDKPWLRTVMFLFGKMCISFSFYTLVVYTMEVFPTSARNSLTNVTSTLGRLGSVLAPQAPLLARFWPVLPQVTFAMAALVAGSLMLLMPDLSNARLPDDLSDVEREAPPSAPNAQPKEV